MSKIFETEAPKYWNKNLPVVPVQPGKKAGIKEWSYYQNNLPKLETRTQWLNQHGHYGIALLTGWMLDNQTRLVGIDVDHDAYVEPIKRIVGPFPCAKKGKKGITIFVRAAKEATSRLIPKKGARIVDVLAGNKMCVLPPSIHPETKGPYEWIGKPLYEVENEDMPFLSEVQLDLLAAIIENEHHAAIMTGASTHDFALSLMASLAIRFNDEELVCRYVAAFLPAGYTGNLREELPGLFRSGKDKFSKTEVVEYVPGRVGPIPLGYTQGGTYVFMHQKKGILAVLSPQAFLAEGNLYDLAPAEFWMNLFPKFNKNGEVIGVNLLLVADCLMQKCRDAGAFIAERVRGSGVWREGKNIILNWCGEIPTSGQYTYVRFVSLPEFNGADAVDAQKLLDWLSLFRWENPGYALLALGWAACAPVCGALEWRPHIFINGPKNCGKSTIIGGFTDLLDPMAIVKDGGSSEAGLRQTVGADSRPVILDEFESDHEVHRMRQVIKMLRSASSAKGAIAKGTPEGKAMQFQLHSTFCLGAINPMRGTAADTSRIVNLCLARHENNLGIKDKIQEGLEYLRRTRGAWPHQMIGLTSLMIENIELFEKAMPPGDIRHNKNMATLIGSAFTALKQRQATKEDAEVLIATLADILGQLAQAHEDDDALECLNHLLCFTDREFSIGHYIKDGRAENVIAPTGGNYPGLDGYGIKLAERGLLVANKHPGLDIVFAGTIWASGAWVSALRRLPGAEFDDNLRPRFSGGLQQRCTSVPYSLLDEPGPQTPLLKL